MGPVSLDEALDLHPLPEGWDVVGAAMVVRATDAEGLPRMTIRYAGQFMAWEGLAAAEMLRDDSLDTIASTAEPERGLQPGREGAGGV